MTKAQILTEIANTYLSVGTPVKKNYTKNYVTHYTISITEIGLSGQNKKPVAKKRNVDFYVYKEGTGEEAAYYDGDELVNTVNSDVTGNGSLLNIGNIYTSDVFKRRVVAAVIKAASDVFNEASTVENHASRLKFSTDAMILPDKYVPTMLGFISLDSTVQSSGGSVADVTIQNIINSNVDKIALIVWPIPNPPTLVLPTDGATGVSTSPDLYWSTVSLAVTYQLQLSTQSNFSNLISNFEDITITTYHVTGLASSTTYYWRVRAVNDDNSLWSSVRYFTTA